ncbi:hypothetical protein [Kroppenstedtia sanguinis]
MKGEVERGLPRILINNVAHFEWDLTFEELDVARLVALKEAGRITRQVI